MGHVGVDVKELLKDGAESSSSASESKASEIEPNEVTGTSSNASTSESKASENQPNEVTGTSSNAGVSSMNVPTFVFPLLSCCCTDEAGDLQRSTKTLRK